jgi:ankyrin repeat protein
VDGEVCFTYSLRMDPTFRAAMAAVEQGDIGCLRQLVSAQPQLLAMTDDEDHSSTLLHAAAGGAHPQVVRALLDLGADVDAMTWTTPLSVAACYGRTENARLLLDAGATVAARSRLGTTPLALAILHGHPHVADLLVARGMLPRTLWVAAGAGDLDAVSTFVHADGSLAEGAGAHREDPHAYGMPSRPLSQEPRAILEEAFKYAWMNARVAVAQHLLDTGVDINATPHVGTPLHWAAYCGHLGMVRFLVDHGADVRARDDEWHGTPKSWAVQNGHEDVIAFLAAREA